MRRWWRASWSPKRERSTLPSGAIAAGERASPFFAHNRRLVAEIERLEHKSRRPDILVDDELMHGFYDARIPEGICSGADFEAWRKEAERANPKLLYLAREDLMRHEAAGITTDNFPPAIQLGPSRFALEYHFEPGSPRDGVTMSVPLALLAGELDGLQAAPERPPEAALEEALDLLLDVAQEAHAVGLRRVADALAGQRRHSHGKGTYATFSLKL